MLLYLLKVLVGYNGIRYSKGITKATWQITLAIIMAVFEAIGLVSYISTLFAGNINVLSTVLSLVSTGCTLWILISFVVYSKALTKK